MKRMGSRFNLIRTSAVVLLTLNLLAIGMALTEFSAPISGDTAIYAYYGRQIAAGQVLYRDLWDFKSPGIYYVFALIFKILPNSLTTLRLFAVACNIFSSYLVYKISCFYFEKSSALLGSAIYLISTNLGGYLNQDGPFPETFMPILGLLGFYFFVASYQGNTYKVKLIISGIFAGLLVVMKQTSISLAGGALLFLCLETLELGWDRASRLPFFFAGMVIAIAPWFVYFWKADAWWAFRDWRYFILSFIRQAHHSRWLSKISSRFCLLLWLQLEFFFYWL